MTLILFIHFYASGDVRDNVGNNKFLLESIAKIYYLIYKILLDYHIIILLLDYK